uniref:Uncharacterized protein n=1 Tax=Anguilla anguilla TaxID=7936 RepID=A0A0E9SYS9_ANGAN
MVLHFLFYSHCKKHFVIFLKKLMFDTTREETTTKTCLYCMSASLEKKE